jgi:anti-sigma factor RsiW
MNCTEFEAQLSPFIDGELPESADREMRAHLEGCAACKAAHERQLALRVALRRHLVPLTAPESLRAGVARAVRDASDSPAPRVRRLTDPRWLALAAMLVAAVAGTWTVATDRANARRVTDEIFASHIRSLMGDHLTDVVSSDQHTVKPWFNGKLDYSPPVYDFAGRGYPLLGGRLEYIAQRPVAALAYGRRQHLINVFLWPVGHGPDAGPASANQQGYHLIHWNQPDYTCWVVSDLGLAELKEFVGLLRESDSLGSSGR